MSKKEVEMDLGDDSNTPEKPYNEVIYSSDTSSMKNVQISDDENSLMSNIIEADVTEIEKQLDKVGEMIFKEEETYAELEKKVNEFKDSASDSEAMTMAYVGDWKSGSGSSSSTDSGDPEEQQSTEDWLYQLVPDVKGVLDNGKEISDEKVFTLEEDVIADAVDVAKCKVLLDSENPMLLKFQSVLKQHLLRQINKLNENILELEGDYKKREVSLKADADFAYRQQLIIVRQRETLENYRNTIENIAQQRKNVEEQIKSQREICCKFKEEYEKTKTEYEHCEGESKMLCDLVNKMSEHEKQQERDLDLSKKKQALNVKEKDKLSKEKQAQDMLVWRITKSILEKKRETEDRLRRAKAKAKECNVLSERLLAASVDRSELLLVNDLLAKELQKAFLLIKSRDNTLMGIKKELQEAETNWKKLEMGLNWYRKNLRTLMEENESLNQQKRKLGDDVQFLNDKVATLNEERFRAMEELNSFDEMLKGADVELEEAEQIGEALIADEEHILQQTSNACGEKMRLERAYMEKLIQRNTTDKMVKHVNDMILKMVEEHKNKELKMYKLENQLAKEMVELELVKNSLRETEHDLEKLNKVVTELENNKSKIENGILKLTNKEYDLKSNITEKRRILDELEKAWTHKTYLDTPLVSKKNKISENIVRLQKSMNKKEEIWLEFQEGCLRASNKRQKQLERINFLRKQVVMMEGSLERCVKKLNELKREYQQVLNEIDNHRRKMSALQVAEAKQGKMRLQAEENTRELEESCINLLKDLEVEAMALQQEVWELEEENERKAEYTEELQRELLEWNKKYSMAMDLKKEIDEEKTKGGEIAAMRLEIHRMEIRFANLRKVEERLTNDLDLCLCRRDSILESAEAKEKKIKNSGITLRAQAWRRIEDTRAKLRTLIREFRELRKEKELCLEQRKFLAGEAEFWKKSVKNLSLSLEELEQQIKEGQVHRHKTLEMTILRQRKMKLLEELKFGKYRVAGKTEENLDKQALNVSQTRKTLLNIIQKLKQDFPLLGLQLKIIENTISFKIDPEEIENK